MRLRRSRPSILRLVVLGLIVFGLTASAATAGKAGPAVFRGGTISMATTLGPNALDPCKAFGIAANSDWPYQEAVYDVLMYNNPFSGKVVYSTARSLTSKDFVVWTLTLKPGIKFTDGTNYDANAVKFNWEREDNTVNACRSSGTLGAKSLQVVNPLSLRITLLAKNSQFPDQVAKFFPFIASPTAIQQQGANYGQSPVGAGPFKLDSMTPTQAVFVKNPTYWQKGLPYFDKLQLTLITDESQRWNSLVTGQTNIINVGANPGLVDRAGAAGGQYRVVTPALPIVNTMFLNMKTAPFNNLIARQALDYAIDRDQYNKIVNQGAYPAPKSFEIKSSPFYDPTVKLTTYNPTKAQQLFDQYAAQNGGPMKFSISIAAGSPQIAAFWSSNFSQFKNVSVSINSLSSTALLAAAAAHNFQAIISKMENFTNPYPDAYINFQTDAGQNFMGYSNPAVDKALTVGISTDNLKTRAKAFSTVQKALLKDKPAVFYGTQRFGTIMSKNINNVAAAYATGMSMIWQFLQVKS